VGALGIPGLGLPVGYSGSFGGCFVRCVTGGRVLWSPRPSFFPLIWGGAWFFVWGVCTCLWTSILAGGGVFFTRLGGGTGGFVRFFFWCGVGCFVNVWCCGRWVLLGFGVCPFFGSPFLVWKVWFCFVFGVFGGPCSFFSRVGFLLFGVLGVGVAAAGLSPQVVSLVLLFSECGVFFFFLVGRGFACCVEGVKRFTLFLGVGGDFLRGSSFFCLWGPGDLLF